MFPLTQDAIKRWVTTAHPDKARDPRILDIYTDAMRQVLYVNRTPVMTCHGQRATWQRDGCTCRCTVCHRTMRNAHARDHAICVLGGEPTPVEWEDATRIARPRLKVWLSV